MTNSMIPYSFVPGTKAKAGEVNANFISIAEQIEQNQKLASNNLQNLKDIVNTKADKTALIHNFTISEADTNLDDYKTEGTYIFSSLYTPTNIPKGTAGILVVTGDENSTIKQIWFEEADNGEVFTRNFQNSEWSDWYSNVGISKLSSIGYLQLSNGLLIQWGLKTGSDITYPIAYNKMACPYFTKNGYSSSARSDTGTINQSLTGFNMGSSGAFNNMNWLAIGY